MLSNKHISNEFLETQRTNGTSITVFIKNGFQMTGFVVNWDDQVLQLEVERKNKYILWSAISTIE